MEGTDPFLMKFSHIRVTKGTLMSIIGLIVIEFWVLLILTEAYELLTRLSMIDLAFLSRFTF